MKFLLTFGDSFSDNGFSNDCGYNRLSNGKVWVEYLSEMLNIPLEDRAWCGAQSGKGNASGPSDWSGLTWQVETYTPGKNTRDAVCTLLIGINDVYDGQGFAEEIVANTISAMEILVTKGVRKFLVSNVPDISDAPAYGTDEYAHLKETVSEKILSINSQLESCLWGTGGFASRNPEITFVPLDAYAVFKRLAHGNQFEVTDTPWNGTYSFPDATHNLWWDEWHPMTEAHRQLALAALAALQ